MDIRLLRLEATDIHLARLSTPKLEAADQDI